MPKGWDRRMKRLFREAPQDLVAWLFPGAEFHDIVSTELDSETIYADQLLDLTLQGVRFLLHIEFQRSRDSRMAERLWEYNVRATLQYGCPVWSCVIYLKKDSTIERSFLTKTLPDGRSVHRFEFEVIKMWEVPMSELKERGLKGLLPLLVLTQDGTRREVVEEAIEELSFADEEPKAELLTLTYGLASLAFEDEADQQWLRRRFAMLYDILRETQAYQDLTKDSHEKGLQEGKLEGLREALFTLVQARFPDPKVIRQARGQAAIIEDPAVLQDLIIKVSLSQTPEEAQKSLLEWPGIENERN